MVRIDSHQHFWRYTPEEYGWIDATMGPLRRDFLPADLAPLLAAAGIDGCLAVQARQSLAETRFLLELAAAAPWIRGVVGWVDLQAPDVDRTLRELAQDRRLVGVRHIAQAEPAGFLLGEAFQRGIAALAPRHLVYDLLVYAHQLPDAEALAARFPGQPFVLDHCGKPAIRQGEFAGWATAIRALARHPHVACKLSGLVTEAAWGAWQPADLRPYVEVVLEAFGPDRVLYGSDWPVCLLACDYPRWVATAAGLVAALAPAEQQKIFGENALRIYAPPPPKPGAAPGKTTSLNAKP